MKGINEVKSGKIKLFKELPPGAGFLAFGASAGEEKTPEHEEGPLEMNLKKGVILPQLNGERVIKYHSFGLRNSMSDSTRIYFRLIQWSTKERPQSHFSQFHQIKLPVLADSEKQSLEYRTTSVTLP